MTILNVGTLYLHWIILNFMLIKIHIRYVSYGMLRKGNYHFSKEVLNMYDMHMKINEMWTFSIKLM